MKKASPPAAIVSFAGILILILDGKTALEGACAGIDLCIKTVIPALFPFLFLSLLLTGTLPHSQHPVLKFLERWTRIPAGSGPLLLTGFLGGYPAGAQCLAAAFNAGSISRQDAERMLAFCNNAGPAFLFGMVAPLLSSTGAAFGLWIIHILSALLTAFLIQGHPSEKPAETGAPSLSAAAGMQTAIRSMAVICGWITVFRIAIAFLDRWFLWMVPDAIQVLTTGLLELSNGCCMLSRIRDPDIRFVVCACILASGGFCVAMQTASAASGLSLKYYFKGKLLQTLFSFLFSSAVVLNVWKFLVPLLIFSVFLQKSQNKSGNSPVIGI